jgi:excisionase family DNA binding protein
VPTETGSTRSYLTVREFAESRGFHPVSVYRFIADGRLLAGHFGRTIRIPVDATPTRVDP